MRALSVGLAEARRMFEEQLDRIGLDEMAATAGVLTDAPPDHDAASYWLLPDDSDGDGSGDSGDDIVARVLWLRRTASAHGARPVHCSTSRMPRPAPAPWSRTPPTTACCSRGG